MKNLVSILSKNPTYIDKYKMWWGLADNPVEIAKHNEKGKFELSRDELVLYVDGINNYINALKADDKEQFIGKERSKTEYTSSHKLKEEGFNYFENWDEMIECFENDPISLKTFTENDDVLTEKYSSGNSVEFDKTGDFLDVSRYLNGEPECFGTMTDGKINTKYLDLIITIGGNAGIKNETLVEYAEMIHEVVDYLEHNKIRCRIFAFTTNECVTTQIKVKEYDEPLSMTDLYVMMNTDFFRRLHFRDVENSPTRKWGYGSGLVKPDIEYLKEDGVSGTLYLKKLSGNSGLGRKKREIYNWINNEFVPNYDVSKCQSKVI